MEVTATPLPDLMHTPLTTTIDLGGTWRICLFFGMVACAVSLLCRYRKRIGTPATLLWGIVLTHALYIIEYPDTPYLIYNTAYMATSGQTFAEALLIPLAVILLSRKWIKSVLDIFQIVMLYELYCIWIEKPALMSFVSNSHSFDTALLALFLPFALPTIMVASLITIFTHHGSTALLMVGAQLFAFSLKKKKYWITIIPVISLAALFYYFRRYNPTYAGAERFLKYENFFSFWIQSPRFVAIGTGPGTFMWTSFLIDKYKEPLFLQMHSDWLQIPFELGFLGLGLSVATVWSAIRRCWHDTTLVMAIFGAVAFGVTYHPLRFMPSMILIGIIFRLALIDKRRSFLE